MDEPHRLDPIQGPVPLAHRPGGGRGVRWTLIATPVVVVAALAGLWGARRPIATGLIDRRLADAHVRAHYRIAALDLGRQRLTDVVIGDPAHPDLVADWVELDTHVGLDGAQVTGVRAGRVRAAGRIVNGTVSLGSIDRLLPASTGQPFHIPAIDLAIDDGRLDLATPAGPVTIGLTGAGRLDGGFRGRIAANAPRLVLNGCRADRVQAGGRVAIDGGQPRVTGPITASRLACGTATAHDLRLVQATALSRTLDRWDGRASLSAQSVTGTAGRFDSIDGALDYHGTGTRTTGSLDLHLARAGQTALGMASDATVRGRYQVQGRSIRFGGMAGGTVAIADRWRRLASTMAAGLPATPLTPMLARLGPALGRAMGGIALSGALNIDWRGSAGTVTVNDVAAQASSGARASFAGTDGILVDLARHRISGDGLLAIDGGGLPALTLRVRPRADGGVAVAGAMRRYAAGDASLALDRIDAVGTRDGRARLSALVTLSGPLPGGSIDALRVPVTLTSDSRRMIVDPGCVPASAARVTAASVTLIRPAVTLCPVHGAMLAVAGGRTTGGVAIGRTVLNGTDGGSPLTVAVDAATADVGRRSFALDGLRVRVGAGDAATRVAAQTLDGRIDQGVVAGHFTGGGGRLGPVPLDLSAAAGQWRFAHGTLAATGAMTVADAAPAPRFYPVSAQDMALTLASGRVGATGRLVNPKTGTALATVTISDDLGSNTGQASVAVPGIAFGKGFQPDDLTPLTRGVIADVAATVTGAGHIHWTGGKVTSDGDFGTTGADLAALFGPVSGLSTRIHFTDLLNLASAPDQVATVTSINTGVAVENGTVHYRLLPGERIDVTGATWPFAGGTLSLRPTILDFTEHQERRLTFRMTGVDAAQFLLQFNFANLNASGVFDGTLPMIFDDRGGRIEGGRLVARAGGGNIAYVGDLSQKDLGFYGNFAFQALKSVNYRQLTIDLNGPLDGEVVTDIRFSGLSQGHGARRNWLVSRLARLPLRFNVRVTAPFRQLLDSAMGFYDPGRYVRRIKEEGATPGDGGQSLPQAAPPIQPVDSDKER